MSTDITHDFPIKSVNVPLSEKAELQLRKRAIAQGLALEDFARFILEREAAAPEVSQSAEDWVSQWRSWTESRPRQELSMDDSRESIYE